MNITEKHSNRYVKNGVSKSIILMIEHTNIELYRVYPGGVIWKN